MINSFQNELSSLLSYSPQRIVPPFSWVGHTPLASYIIKTLEPSVLVELGTHSGNSLCAFAQSVKENNLQTKIYAVDTWTGDEHSGLYSEDVFQKLNSYVKSNYKFVELMRMTFDEAQPKFTDQSIDILHVDGLHTYEAVKHDFHHWLPKIKSDGIVIFHDIKEKQPGFGVYKIWDQLKKAYPTAEFSHSHGLGILFLDQKLKKIESKEVYDSLSPESNIYSFLKLKGESILLAKINESIEKELKNLRKEHSLIVKKPEEIAKKISFANLVKAVSIKIKRKIVSR